MSTVIKLSGDENGTENNNNERNDTFMLSLYKELSSSKGGDEMK